MREGAITTLINPIEHMLLDTAFMKSQPNGDDKLFKNIYFTTRGSRPGEKPNIDRDHEAVARRIYDGYFPPCV